MTELLLFLEFLFWFILRAGLLILLLWCSFDILDIIDTLEEEHQNKNTESKDVQQKTAPPKCSFK